MRRKSLQYILFIVIFILVVGGVGYVWADRLLEQKEMPKGVATNGRTEHKAEQSGIKEFVSNELGVSFQYPSYIKDITIEGNRIKIGSNSVEIFDKASEQTLQQAIKDMFLNGYDSSTCWVDTSNRDSRTYAMLEFPRPKGEWDLGTLDVTCPIQYASVGGLTYFMMDLVVPDKFAVFSIGQNRIMISDTLSWDNTFEFVR